MASSRFRRLTLADGLADLSAEIHAGIKKPSTIKIVEEEPLWRPMDPQPGRGFRMPDGRLVSPQQAAVESLADELYFGGMPGGGKSDLGLGLALTKHKNSIIYRLEAKQFKGTASLWERSRELIGLRGDSNGTDLSWRNLPGGRTLEMGGVRTDADLLKWKGRPHDLIVFEELPEHSKRNFQLLKAWLRTSIPGQRCRVVCPGNPPMTDEGQWVIDYWGPWLDPSHPNPAQEGELRWFAAIGDKDVEVKDGSPIVLPASNCQHEFSDIDVRCRRCKGQIIRPLSRTFISSSVEDNPYYLATGYMKQLDALPEGMRQVLRYANFTAGVQEDPMQVIPGAWVDAAQARWKPEDGMIGEGDDAEDRPTIRIGCDVSRGGVDEFVNTRAQGDPQKFIWVAPQDIHPAKSAKDGEEGARLVSLFLGDDDAPVQIDIGGPGYSVRDFAIKIYKMKVLDFNGSEATDYTDANGRLKFYNKRAATIWQMRKLLDPKSDVKVALPPDKRLKTDLCSSRWEMTVRGVKIQDKEEIKKRIGHSPDRGESCIYACVDGSAKAAKKKRQVSLTWGPATRKALGVDPYVK